MAAKPHVVRNGYIALKDVDDAVLRCWAGDIVDVPAAWVDMLTRQGVIDEDARPVGYGVADLPAGEAVDPPAAAEAATAGEPGPDEDAPADESGEPGEADEQSDAPPVRRRGRARRQTGDGEGSGQE